MRKLKHPDQHTFGELTKLIKRAREACRKRHHRMKFKRNPLDRFRALGTCTECGKWVQCLVKPQANEIDVGGPAVATGCVR
jgi:hypothetical protein